MEVDEIAKLSQYDIKIILDMYKKGETFTKIAKTFNISRQSITRKIKDTGFYQLKTEKACKLCGEIFYPTAYGSQIQKYCSNACRNKAYAIKNNIVTYNDCKYCSGKFKVGRRKKLCSEECANKQKELEKIRNRKLKKCCYCGRWHYGFLRKYCSKECKYKANRVKDELRKSERLKRARSNGQFDADIDIYKLIERDGGCCYLCGDDVLFSYHYNDPKYPTIEHVLPISKGGSHSWDNVKVACRECNTRKSTTLIDDYLKGR